MDAVKTKSLYQRLLEAGCEISNHESNLYVKKTADSERIILEYKREVNDDHRGIPDAWVSCFRNNNDRQTWYEVPMMFDPWWEKRYPGINSQ
jgi:hypothetical protein